jgi:hypothetical protein
MGAKTKPYFSLSLRSGFYPPFRLWFRFSPGTFVQYTLCINYRTCNSPPKLALAAHLVCYAAWMWPKWRTLQSQSRKFYTLWWLKVAFLEAANGLGQFDSKTTLGANLGQVQLILACFSLSFITLPRQWAEREVFAIIQADLPRDTKVANAIMAVKKWKRASQFARAQKRRTHTHKHFNIPFAGVLRTAHRERNVKGTDASVVHKLPFSILISFSAWQSLFPQDIFTGRRV